MRGIWLCAAALLLLPWFVGSPADGERHDPDAAPLFGARTLDGRVFRLADLRGQPVVIEFWAVRSSDSRAQLGTLQRLAERYRGRGLQVLGLSVDEDDPVVLRRTVRKLGIRFPVAPADDQVLDLYGPIRTLPTTCFVNRKGDVERRLEGALDPETVEGYVREIL
jgi:peroxiredoxin